MNTSKKFLSAIAFIVSSSALCYPQDVALDFEQAVRALEEKAVHPRRGLYYYDMKDAVNGFIAKHEGVPAVEFLEAKIGEPNSRKPALLSLAKLAATDAAAENSLYRMIDGDTSVIQMDALTAIAYLDPRHGRRIAEALLRWRGSWHVRRTAVDMLVGLGDRNTLEKLKQMQQAQEDVNVKKSFESPISQLEYRLTQVPADKQAEWAHQEIKASAQRPSPPPGISRSLEWTPGPCTPASSASPNATSARPCARPK